MTRQDTTGKQISLIIERFRPEFPALSDHLYNFAMESCERDEKSGALIFSGLQTELSGSFPSVIFPSIDDRALAEVCRNSPVNFPATLLNLYRVMNGGFFGTLSLYGVVQHFGRESRAPLDVAMGDIWRVNYADAPDDLILFASENVSWEGQVGYFMEQSGSVVGRGNLKDKAPADFGSWADLNSWLADRLGAGKIQEG